MRAETMSERGLMWILAVLVVVTILIVILAILSGGSAFGAPPPDPKGGYNAPAKQATLEEEIIPPHPHAVSEGQWGFWAAVVGGVLTCAASGIGGYALVRSRKRRGGGKKK